MSGGPRLAEQGWIAKAPFHDGVGVRVHAADVAESKTNPRGETMKFKIGDLAITCNTKASILNENLLVTVSAIQAGFDQRVPHYWIRRLDGQPFPSSKVLRTGEVRFFAEREVLAPEWKLRPVAQDVFADEDVLLSTLE
jgi:hypothetical protein